MIYFIQIDGKTKFVKGYSSSKIDDSDLEISGETLNERFFNLPMFHIYDEVSNTFSFDEGAFNKYKKEKENRLTNEQLLGQKCSDLEIQIMMMQQMMQQQPTAGI